MVAAMAEDRRQRDLRIAPVARRDPGGLPHRASCRPSAPTTRRALSGAKPSPASMTPSPSARDRRRPAPASSAIAASACDPRRERRDQLGILDIPAEGLRARPPTRGTRPAAGGTGCRCRRRAASPPAARPCRRAPPCRPSSLEQTPGAVEQGDGAAVARGGGGAEQRDAAARPAPAPARPRGRRRRRRRSRSRPGRGLCCPCRSGLAESRRLAMVRVAAPAPQASPRWRRVRSWPNRCRF